MTGQHCQRATLQLLRTLLEDVSALERHIVCRELASACLALAGEHQRPPSGLYRGMVEGDPEEGGP